MRPRDILPLVKRTLGEWIDDNAPSRAASLSYYTVFSIAPLLVIAVAVASIVFGRDAVTGELHGQLRSLLGDAGAKAIQDMMISASRPGAGVLASVLGVVMLLAGATGAFVELQDTLNVIWDVDKTKMSGIVGFVRARLLSFAMVGVIAFLLLASLVISAILSAVGHFAEERLPGGEVVFQVINFLVSFGVITVLFAAIYKVLPDAKIPWRDVWLGAAVTSLLFGIGKLLIALYLGKTGVASSYGAAGSFAVLLIWINYTSMILLLGAEFTQVYSHSHGSKASPGAEAKADRPESSATAARVSHA
jgi:membrane protein